MIATK